MVRGSVIFASFVFTAVFAFLPSHVFSQAECRTVVWEGPEYKSLIQQGWGPIVMFAGAPPAGTTIKICSGWRDSMPTVPSEVGIKPPETNTPTADPRTTLEHTYGCPDPGERRATSADIPLMKAAGYPENYAVVGNCWKPTDPNVGQEAGEAKQYLRSILCPPDRDNYGGMGPDGTIQGLDSKLAVCASKFLKAANQTRRVCLSEGKRSVDKQNEYVRRGILACKHGARCEHPRGVAIDIKVVGSADSCASYTWLHNMAPQYGLNFYLRCRDSYHFVALKGECSAGGTVPAGSTVPSTNFDFPQYYNGPQGSMPSTPFTNALRSLFTPSPLPYQPIPIQNTGSQYVQPTPTYSPPPPGTGVVATEYTPQPSPQQQTSTSSEQQQQQQSSATTSSINVSSNTNTNQNITDTNIGTIDQIAVEAMPQDRVIVTTSTPAALNENLKNLGSIADQTKIAPPAQDTGIQPVPNPYGTATFAPAPNDGSSYNPQQLSVFANVLTTLKAGLVKLSQFLQPFRGQYYIR